MAPLKFNLLKILPDEKTAINLNYEQIGWLILEELNKQFVPKYGTATIRGRPTQISEPELELCFSEHNETIDSLFSSYSSEHRGKIKHLVVSAISWLKSEALIAIPPGGDQGFFILSVKGRDARIYESLDKYNRSQMLNYSYLCEEFKTNVWPIFINGLLDAAVFAAFREVEIKVSNESGISDKKGSDLISFAFRVAKEGNQNQDPGPLTDPEIEINEQKALRNLYDGAIGYFRNPSAHRITNITAEEAVESIIFANYLMRRVKKP